jgi:tetratricopeptide (TPR) repeat protein
MPADEEAEAPARRGGGGRKVAAVLALLLASAAAAFAYVELSKKPTAQPSAALVPEAVADAAPAEEPAGSMPLDAAPADAADPLDADGDAPDDAALDAGDDAVADDAPPDDAPAADEADIDLDPPEPLAPADPEIESVDPEPEPPSDDDTPTEGIAPSSAPPPTTTPPPSAAAPPTPPVVRTVAQALALAKQGRRDDAIAGLRALWKKQPRNANLPYVLGNLYHDKRWWSVAMEHYQAAISRAPAYKRNGTLTRNVISMLASPRTRTKASWFLRKIVGAPAKAHLRTAAKHHKSPAVRKYAAAVLRRF